jgi:hypothetical protein
MKSNTLLIIGGGALVFFMWQMSQKKASSAKTNTIKTNSTSSALANAAGNLAGNVAGHAVDWISGLFGGGSDESNYAADQGWVASDINIGAD